MIVKMWYPGCVIWVSSAFLVIAAPFIGSFLGVVIARLPRGQSILFGRSTCDCGRMVLGPRDLIPVLGWALNFGRCRVCARTLSAFYPAIELAALIAAIWSLALLPPSIAWIGAAFGWTLLLLGCIDLREQILPDSLTLPLAAAGILVIAIIDSSRLADHMIGAVAGYLSLMTISWIYRRWREREGLGQGDAKLFAALGAWVGWQGLPTVMLYAAVGALLVVAMGALRGKPIARDHALPFGPYLCAGGWLVWLYGPLLFG